MQPTLHRATLLLAVVRSQISPLPSTDSTATAAMCSGSLRLTLTYSEPQTQCRTFCPLIFRPTNYLSAAERSVVRPQPREPTAFCSMHETFASIGGHDISQSPPSCQAHAQYSC